MIKWLCPWRGINTRKLGNISSSHMDFPFYFSNIYFQPLLAVFTLDRKVQSLARYKFPQIEALSSNKVTQKKALEIFFLTDMIIYRDKIVFLPNYRFLPRPNGYKNRTTDNTHSFSPQEKN